MVLATQSELQASDDTAASQKSRKGRKRARGYEGDEVFKLSKEIICPGPDEGQVIFVALEGIIIFLLCHVLLKEHLQ